MDFTTEHIYKVKRTKEKCIQKPSWAWQRKNPNSRGKNDTNYTFSTFSIQKPSEIDYLLLLNNRFIDSPIEEGLNAWMNLRDGALVGSSLLVFLRLEDPPTAPMLLTDPDDFVLKTTEPNEASLATNDTGPLCDASWGYPTAPSWCGGGNFSLLLLTFVCVIALHLWKSAMKHIFK